MAEHREPRLREILAYNEAFTRAGMFFQALGHVVHRPVAARGGAGVRHGAARGRGDRARVRCRHRGRDVRARRGHGPRGPERDAGDEPDPPRLCARSRPRPSRSSRPAPTTTSTASMATYGFRGVDAAVGRLSATACPPRSGMVGMVLGPAAGRARRGPRPGASGGSLRRRAARRGVGHASWCSRSARGWALSAVRANQAAIEVRFRSVPAADAAPERLTRAGRRDHGRGMLSAGRAPAGLEETAWI